MTERVRIKICGLTRSVDVTAAVYAGADAIGFNCYRRSPRFVDLDQLSALARGVPVLVTPVLLFVNASPKEVHQAIERVPHAVLQFHGTESEAECAQFGRPYLRAIAMAPGVGLLDFERQFGSASALLADTPSTGFGGSGQVFDWNFLPVANERSKPLILAGGLNESNVAQAIRIVQPYAVDVSSGVEREKGVKDPARIERFIAAVRAA